MSYDCHRNVIRMSYDLSYDYYTIVIRLSYDCHTIVIRFFIMIEIRSSKTVKFALYLADLEAKR